LDHYKTIFEQFCSPFWQLDLRLKQCPFLKQSFVLFVLACAASGIGHRVATASGSDCIGTNKISIVSKQWHRVLAIGNW